MDVYWLGSEVKTILFNCWSRQALLVYRERSLRSRDYQSRLAEVLGLSEPFLLGLMSFADSL